MTTTRASRNDTLDCVRAFLVISVMAYHYLVFWGPPAHQTDLLHFDSVFNPNFRFGFLAVHMFFILSGYFITVTVSKSSDAFEFGYRRLIRIYPAFVVATIFVFWFTTQFGPEELKVSVWDLAGSFTLLPHDLHFRPVDDAFWSLAVEVKFYFWIGVCFFLLKERFAYGMVALAASALVIEQFSYSLAFSVLISTRMSYFLFGMSLAFVQLGRTRTATLLAVSSAIMFATHLDVMTPVDNTVAVAGSLLLAILIISRLSLSARPIAYLGLISYELYLVHENIGVTIIGHMKTRYFLPDTLAVLVAATFCIALAAFIHHIAAKPITLLLRAAYMRGRTAIEDKIMPRTRSSST